MRVRADESEGRGGEQGRHVVMWTYTSVNCHVMGGQRVRQVRRVDDHAVSMSLPKGARCLKLVG